MSDIENVEPRPASFIEPKPARSLETLSDCYNNIESIYTRKEIDQLAALSFTKGFDKNTQPDVTIVDYLKSINTLICDYISQSHELNDENIRTIKISFDTVNKLYELLEFVDQDMSKELISCITGYNFKILKKVYKIN